MKLFTHHRRASAERGQALIVVLCFVTLFIAITLLLLLRSSSASQLSSNSIAAAKAHDLALSGGELVIGDLLQEIIDGSAVTTYGAAPDTYTVYQPRETGAGGTATSVPSIVGFTPLIVDGIETDGLANLTKISRHGTPFYSSTANANYTGEGTSRASAVSSSSTSLDGRRITPARWNSHYLIARPPEHQGTGLNATPVAAFPVPDWVIVSRSGASKAYTDADIPMLRDTAHAEYAVGRIAYAVYNEGGVLDMNAAGFPGSLTPQQSCRKSSLAFADLKQLGLTQAQVDQIIGWRNSYTSQLGSGSAGFGSVTFDPAAGTNWLQNFADYNYCDTTPGSTTFGKKQGFLTVNSKTLPAGGSPAAPSDQMMVSRQQLIRLVQSLGLSPDVLQYMGTFSRSLEQPSTFPHPDRPRVLSPTTPPPTVGGTPNESKYVGNNDAAGGDDIINPAFLSIRVATPFTRLDGTPAEAGEPLVRHRFALNDLAMVAYDAENTSLPPGFSATAHDSDPIYNRFGLRRSDPSAPWVYDHGSNTILTLDKVAAAGREPDFAELLKAAISVGALAKGAPNLATNQSNFQYTLDTAVDYHVLQIMANLIDQQDEDGYPTCIQINSGPGGATVISGAEDMPYFYRYHVMSVVEELPDPLLSKSDVLSLNPVGITQQVRMSKQWDYPSGSLQPSTFLHTIIPNTKNKDSKGNLIPWAINRTKKGQLINPGKVSFMMVPNLWNPYDPATAGKTSTVRPTKYRIFAQTANPSGGAKWKVGSVSVPTGYYPDKIVPEDNNVSPNLTYYWPASSANDLGPTNTEMIFSDNEGTLFREPTLLWSDYPWKTNPAATKLQSKGSVTDANTNKRINGIILGTAPVSFEITVQSTPVQPAVDGTYVVQTTQTGFTEYIPAKSGGYNQISFVLQYLDASNKWVTYQSVYPDYHGLAITQIIANPSEFANGQYYNPFYTDQLSDNAGCVDPRTARWGIGTGESPGNVSAGTKGNSTSAASAFLLEPLGNKNVLLGSAAAANIFKANEFSVMETARPRADKGNFLYYSLPGNNLNVQQRLFSGVGFSASIATSSGDVSPLFYPGLMSQNHPHMIFNARSNKTTATLHFEDADGMCRRAMGAYANMTMTDSTTSSLAQPIATSPNRIGLPLATASTFNNSAVAIPTQQAQSRPLILNRPFNSVSEMSYAFTGTAWKNIDFFTPESGYCALLDTFCVGRPPANPMVAGKLDLNTRQHVALQAVLAGASRDESSLLDTPPDYALPPLTSPEAAAAAQRLVAYTSSTSDTWRGPLNNVSDLVGRYVSTMPSNPLPIAPGASPDWFTYLPPTPVGGQRPSITYAGFAPLLDSTVYKETTNSSHMVSPVIQRFRESALRPLADCGQTRVWNLMIDVIAQTGKYPRTADSLEHFVVEGEKRLWIHIAIDRLTGEILDKQVEVVAQ